MKFLKLNGHLFGCLLVLILSLSFASAKDYVKEADGMPAIEIGIKDTENFALESETICFDFSETISSYPDEYEKSYTASYEILSLSSKEIETYIAVARVINVSEVEISSDEVENFDSGSTIKVNGGLVNGRIFAFNKLDKILDSSSYDETSETLMHLEYSQIMGEAFTLIDAEAAKMKSNVPESSKKKMFKVSEDGERMLCVVVYPIRFQAGQQKTVDVEYTMCGRMTRPTKNSDLGSLYNFKIYGETLNTFTNVDDIFITFKLNEKNLPLNSSSVPYYLEDGVKTIHIYGKGKNYDFTIGKELTKDEINDINTSIGFGKKLFDFIEIIIIPLVLAALVFIIYTYRKRKQSGIGNDFDFFTS